MYKGRIFVCGRQSEEIDVQIKTNWNIENEKCFLKKEKEEEWRIARQQKNYWVE